ncbi:MAG TPA: hypothetical protein VHN99_00905, partial [Deinococcales bacterium]|nr:hypothetical protein [Deinococcales bacterium]
LQTIVSTLEQAVRGAPERLRQAVRDALASVHAAQGSSPAGSAAWREEQAVRGNPGVALADGVSQARRDQATVAAAEALAAQQESQRLADQLAQSTASKDAAQAVLDPQSGTAAVLEASAVSAVSTREGITALAGGLADLMRQDATQGEQLADQVKALAQQQALTNWQLQLAVSSLSRQQDAREAQAQAELQARLSAAYQDGKTNGQTLQAAVQDGLTVFDVPQGDLQAGSLGW